MEGFEEKLNKAYKFHILKSSVEVAHLLDIKYDDLLSLLRLSNIKKLFRSYFLRKDQVIKIKEVIDKLKEIT
ncbi:MAG: hypothetical protein KatS3mg090_1016 [Patescibacteria group bacterium]|nr:MAG: hypothetical protein KatS3mg090_1016 [Patescibacteria group bacterium]